MKNIGFGYGLVIMSIGRLAAVPGRPVQVENEKPSAGMLPTKLIIVRHAEREK